MTEVQHTIKVRQGKALIDIPCPPFTSIDQLNLWLHMYLDTHPGATVVSKSWSSNASA